MASRVSLKIIGLVQGINYRYLSQQQAQISGLVGYVKNLDDGSVELVVEGDASKLKKFVRWCYNGVGSATVLKIEENWSGETGEFSEFMIKS